MYGTKKFEFNIAKKILNYDLKNIEKEIENLTIAIDILPHLKEGDS